jgi:hypothetical protein
MVVYGQCSKPGKWQAKNSSSYCCCLDRSEETSLYGVKAARHKFINQHPALDVPGADKPTRLNRR